MITREMINFWFIETPFGVILTIISIVISFLHSFFGGLIIFLLIFSIFGFAYNNNGRL